MVVLTALFALCMAASPGWDNGGSRKRITVPKPIWRAPMGSNDFLVSRNAGGEGRVTFRNNSIIIEKTNAEGEISVVPYTGFTADSPRTFRASAEVACSGATPLESKGALRLNGTAATACRSDVDQRQWGFGLPRNDVLVNTPPDLPEMKYGYFHADSTNGLAIRPRIVVSGAPSRSVWRNIEICEDAEVCRAWGEWRRSVRQPNRSPTVSESEYLSACAAGIDHVAKVVRENGHAVLKVDGKAVPPVFYKSVPPNADYQMKGRHAGERLTRSGVALQCATLILGKSGRYPNGRWSREGFDVEGAVSDVSSLLRVVPDSLFVLGLALDPPETYAADHPDETWVSKFGTRVYGMSGGAIEGCVRPGEPFPKGKHALVSMSSLLWRNELKHHLSTLIDALRAHGLTKRIIGVHLYGFHDGQFATSPWPDLSKPALEAYRRKIGDPNASLPPVLEREYLDLSHPQDQEVYRWLDFVEREPNAVMNDIARHVKTCFGKDIIAIRWCMSAFDGQYDGCYDVGDFTECDALDILVAQPSYGYRAPGLPLPCRMPLASFDLHGKIYVDEFDFRTWNSWESCMTSEMSAMGLGALRDFPEWQSGYRRAAGRMFAHGMGFWFYDIGGGWFDNAEIAADIADSLRFDSTPSALGAAWRPDLAVIIDERNEFNVNLLAPHHDRAHLWRDAGSADYSDHVLKFSVSGVPFDVWLAEDLFAHPEIATKYKALTWTCCIRMDERRKAFADAFCANGGRILGRAELPATTAESFRRFAVDAGCYVATDRAGLQVDMNGDFISLHALVGGHYDFKIPHGVRVRNLKNDMRTDAPGGILPLDVVAGETRWYRIEH